MAGAVLGRTGFCRKKILAPAAQYLDSKYATKNSAPIALWQEQYLGGRVSAVKNCTVAGAVLGRTGFCCKKFLAPAAQYLDTKYATKNYAPIALWQEQYLGGRVSAVKKF